MSRQKTSLASLIWVLTACASHTPAPEVSPHPSQPITTETTQIDPTKRMWQLVPSKQRHTYRSISYTIIHDVAAPKPRTDTLTLNTYFTLDVNQLQTPTTISGYIDSVIAAQTSARTSRLDNPSSRVGFIGEITDGELTLKLSTNQAECTSRMTPVLGEIRPVITTYSQTLSLSSTWTDSISAMTCSGSEIPTTLKVIRSYRVLGETTHSTIQALVIERSEATHFNGSGNHDHHQVQIEGVGTSTSRVYLNITNGATIAVESTQKVDTAIRSSGRVQHFTQDIKQKIELVP